MESTPSLRHLFEILLEEHTHSVGTRKGLSHQDEVTTEVVKKFGNKHVSYTVWFMQWKKRKNGAVRFVSRC